jgi:hypothetical protein
LNKKEKIATIRITLKVHVWKVCDMAGSQLPSHPLEVTRNEKSMESKVNLIFTSFF